MCFWFRIFIAFIVCAWAGAVVAVETKVYSQVNICNRNMTFSQKGYYKLMGALSRLSKETVKWKFPKLLTFLNKCFLCFFFHSHIKQWVTFCSSFFSRNCLFRALGDQIEGDHTSHMRHRRETVKYMRDHRSDFEPFMEDNISFDKHCKTISVTVHLLIDIINNNTIIYFHK